MKSPIANELFTDFLNCKYKAHLKLNDESGQASDFGQLQARLSKEYRVRAAQRLVQSHLTSDVSERPDSLSEAIKLDYAVITETHATVGDTYCYFDALLRSAGPSPSSRPEYSPVLFLHTEKVSKNDKLLLAFCGSVLHDLQGNAPKFGRVMHGNAFTTSKVQLPKLIPTARQITQSITDLGDRTDPPPLRLNRHCSICEFRESCYAHAREKDDLSLLRGLNEREVIKLNGKGIFTVTQYSHTYRPRRKRKSSAKRSAKHDYALQARAIRDSTLYIAQKPTLPSVTTRIYLDVEGIPDRNFYYLVGLRVSDGTNTQNHSFWANNDGEEQAIWDELLQILTSIDDFAVFHYGSYDSTFIRKMQERYGGDADTVSTLQAACVNVLSCLHTHLYFPVYSNDLKSIGSCLGVKWTADKASGIQSILWRYEWEMAGSSQAKRRLLEYNLEDCVALESLVERIYTICKGTVDDANATSLPVSDVGQLVGDSPFNFGKQMRSLPEFASITKHAYFDYQRDKVQVRTNKAVRRIVRRTRHTALGSPKVNAHVAFAQADQCRVCGSKRSYTCSRVSTKTVIDLKFSQSGVKRWVTEYTAPRSVCKSCRRSTTPKDFLRLDSKYGHNLCMWCVYCCVALRQSNENIVEGLRDIWGLNLGPGRISNFKRRAARYYGNTYAGLLSQLRNGPLIHADETWAPITGLGRGYVWTFADMQTAVYVYAETREASVVEKVLGDFRGVLVSDFYSAYDSMKCPQQKCLIHLIRDMNDDLFKNPFDDELKQLASGFAVLLQSIVGTIDRYGLKRRHLNKHRKQVEQFYRMEVNRKPRSEVALGYKRRLEKYRDKLFTFLEYDGIPWNNNNAENAIKLFVARRKVVGTSFAAEGLKDYLVLLSI
jgi:predicted RecB family nuclease